MAGDPEPSEERFCLQCGPVPDRLVQDVVVVDDKGRCIVCRYKAFSIRELQSVLSRVGHTIVPGAASAAIVAWYNSTPENRDEAEEQLRKIARAAT